METQDNEMVPALLAMKAGLDEILRGPFAGNEGFANALKEVCACVSCVCCVCAVCVCAVCAPLPTR